VISDKEDYDHLVCILQEQNGATSQEQTRAFAAKAFFVVMNYDIAINNYFNEKIIPNFRVKNSLRYGENPHQTGVFYGNLPDVFEQLNGKELSYNNLVDADAAVRLLEDFSGVEAAVFAIFKHTNVCGI